MLLALSVSACAADDGSGPAETDQLQVVAAFYPLEFVAEQVGGERLAVTGLAPPGVDAHDLELTPQQIAAVAAADLVVYLTGFQPAVDEVVSAHARAALDAAEVVPLLGPEPDHHPGHGAEDGDGHIHYRLDPHVWLDPTRLAAIGDALADQLRDIDPDHADDYAATAATLAQQLAALDTEYAEGLASCQRRELVVSHAAFGYLADRYNLTQIAVAGLSPEDEPTPQRLAEVIHEAERHDATTIFFEVLVSDRVAQVIAAEVGAQTAVLDPIEGLASGSSEDYLSLMRTNLATLRDALECA